MRLILDKRGILFASFVVFMLLILLMSFFVLDMTGKVIQGQNFYVSEECFEECINFECEDFKKERFLNCSEVFEQYCIEECRNNKKYNFSNKE